jgi:uncharacterized protein YndB with AHSA1/START domain
MQRVDVTHDFTLPVERVYAFLAEHENLGPLFGARITRLRDGDSNRNGVGSARTLKVGPLPSFVETVVEAVENERIVYRITQGSPLRGHEGVMSFSALPTGSRLRYTIAFDAVVPGVAPLVAIGLKRNITRGLATVDRKA